MAGVNVLRRRYDTCARRGISIIELAIVLPLVLLLILGLLEYGWVFRQSYHIANAARQGARWAAPPEATRADAENVIQVAMAQAGIGVSDYTVTWNPASDVSAGELFTCTVTVAYDDIALGMPLVPTPDTLESSITMRKEGP